MDQKLSDVGFITILTAFSYSTAYLYQYGYFSYFNIPYMFINIDLPNLVASLVSIAIGAVFIIIVLNGITSLIPDGISNEGYRISVRYIFFGLGYFGYYITGFLDTNPSFHYFLAGMIFLLLIMDFILPLITQRKIEGYKNKVLNAETTRRKSDKGPEYKYSLLNLFRNRIPYLPMLIFIFMLSGLFSYVYGHYTASNQTIFSTLKYKGNKAILFKEFKDGYVLGLVNIKKQTIDPSYFIIKNIEGLLIKREDIGKLKVNN